MNIDEEILRKLARYNEKLPMCQRMNEFLSKSLNPIKIIDEPVQVKQEDKNEKELEIDDESQSQAIQYKPSLNTFVTSINPETRDIDKVKRIATGLDKKYDYYQQHPESHPNYHAEWRSWYLKQKEAAAKGENLQEWIKYWKDQLKKLKEEEFEELRRNIVQKDVAKDDVSSNKSENKITSSSILPLSPSYSSSSLLSPNEAETEQEEECIIVEQERVLIEVSDDDDSGLQSSPKRQKIAEPEKSSPQEKILPKKVVLSENERMVIAIQIAHQIFVENRQPEPEELKKLVKIYCDEEKPLKTEDHQEIFDFTDLSNDDFTVLYQNYQMLSEDEQENYVAALKVIEKEHPERFSGILEKVKGEKAN